MARKASINKSEVEQAVIDEVKGITEDLTDDQAPQVVVKLFLFDGAEEELDGRGPNPADLRELGARLAAHLEEVALAVEKLVAAGWEADVALNDVYFFHPKVRTVRTARKRLRALGLDPKSFEVLED